MFLSIRPILIEVVIEASYPSSTTLLVLSVMPTMVFQAKRRLTNKYFINITCIFTYLYSTFMVIGRLFSGVHWFTDIIGGILLSAGLFLMYVATVEIWGNKK